MVSRLILSLSFIVSVVLLLSACASNEYQSTRESYLDDAQTQTKLGVTVTVAVPSASETRQLFGAPLYQQGIQPVWLDIANNSPQRVNFLPVGLDPRYFTPIESAELTEETAREIDPQLQRRLFVEKRIFSSIAPGERVSGFMFTQLDEGAKSFNVDIQFPEDKTRSAQFSFIVPVPGLILDHQDVSWDTLYPPQQIQALERDQLIQTLEALPCCTTDKRAEDPGDPLNLVVIGEVDDVYYAFLRAGWDQTEVINTASLLKMFGALVRNDEYRYSPVSGLYVFNRPQDVAMQKARQNIHERNHLRLWLTPYRYQDTPVWIGQISRDIGIRFTKRTITTHKIDPDVDETREFLLENLAYSQVLKKYGYVQGVGAAPFESPRANLTGDPYFTDGKRVVLWISPKPVALSEIQELGWGEFLQAAP